MDGAAQPGGTRRCTQRAWPARAGVSGQATRATAARVGTAKRAAMRGGVGGWRRAGGADARASWARCGRRAARSSAGGARRRRPPRRDDDGDDKPMGEIDKPRGEMGKSRGEIGMGGVLTGGNDDDNATTAKKESSEEKNGEEWEKTEWGK
ncbi:hypothetical protein GUJ93_ZPchr0004g39053 [Zizania palustris]|uniref:Uncharacterized protein n=1 Tax=Zizania palustris TaxID=103762 RepID=A0A8J5SHQ0_ZIZPA|nr:hypothetical protein GUJ93_ZPchr0004g39053 [Zizania palustris]